MDSFLGLSILILAAGKGSRMYSDIPKVLHRLGGRTLLDHVVATARSLHPDELCIVYGHGGERVKTSVPGSDILWVEQKAQLGTAHAVQCALPLMRPGNRILILYGDVPLIADETLRRFLEKTPLEGVGVLTAHVPEPQGLGRILRDSTQRVIAIVEEQDANEEQKHIREINTGILCAPYAVLKRFLQQADNHNQQGEYYLTDLVAWSIAHRATVSSAQVSAHHEIQGVNTQRQLVELERLYQHRYAQALLDQGVWVADPQRLDVRGQLTCGRGVRLDINVVIEGDVTLGDHVFVGAHSYLKSCVIEAGTHIHPFSMIEQAHVGTHCHIGPYARLRPGTHLGASVKLGNFVEVKNSRLEDGVKASHLSYLGDARIGAHSNIGACVVTCNYDGQHKYATEIAAHAFVGSHVSLIAPVTVGAHALIAAGTTLMKSAPAEQTTLNPKTLRSRPLPSARKVLKDAASLTQSTGGTSCVES